MTEKNKNKVNFVTNKYQSSGNSFGYQIVSAVKVCRNCFKTWE